MVWYKSAGQSVWGPHLTPWVKSVRGPFLKNKASFCRTEPLEWRFGVHKESVRGPSKFAQNGTDLWTLNRHHRGPRTGIQIGHFCADFASNPYFYSVFVQITISNVKNFGTIFVKISHPRKPIWTGVGPFCGPRTAFQNGTTIRAPKKKQKHPPQKKGMKPNAYFCRKEPFCNQKKVAFSFDGLGRSKHKKKKTPYRRCAKNTTKQGVLFIFVLVLRYSFLPKTTFQLNKTTYTK